MAAASASPTPITRAEYDELVRRGALDDARVELLYGRIVSMPPIGKRHRYSVTNLAEQLIPSLAGRARVHVQQPFAAPDESEPEPDIAVVAPGDYLDNHPETAWLIVEVADSSLARDHDKARLYSAAAAVEYWIVNLADEVVEVHRKPQGAAGYGLVTWHRRGDVLRLVSFPELALRVDDMLPPRR